jgi:Rieske 2Fe-2S family protein
MAQFLKATEIGTAGAFTLPRRFFVSPEVFADEQARIFQRQWLCAGRADAIPKPGDYFLRTIGHDSVIAVRDGDGAVQAYHNTCRHRGSRLCEAETGRFGKTIQCPYHAWTYGLDGDLIGAPGMDELDGFSRDDYPLHDIAVAEWEGFLFIALREPETSFEESHAPLIGRLARFGLPRLVTQRMIQYNVRANWKLLFENYSECYHCPTVHPALVELSPADSGENDFTSGPFLGGFMTVKRPGGSMSHSGQACAMPVSDLPEEDRRRVYYYSIFPNMLLSLHHDYVMYHMLWPEAPDRTRIDCGWLFHPDAAAQPGFNPEDGIDFWDMTNRQDWHICEQSQLGVSSSAYTPGPYAPRDAISAAFDREYLRVMESQD